MARKEQLVPGAKFARRPSKHATEVSMALEVVARPAREIPDALTVRRIDNKDVVRRERLAGRGCAFVAVRSARPVNSSRLGGWGSARAHPPGPDNVTPDETVSYLAVPDDTRELVPLAEAEAIVAETAARRKREQEAREAERAACERVNAAYRAAADHPRIRALRKAGALRVSEYVPLVELNARGEKAAMALLAALTGEG